jgi:hypothetical protein
MCVTSRGEVALQLSTHFITRPKQLSTCCPICPTSLPACAVHSQHQPYPTGMHPVAVGGRWPDKGHTVAVQCWCLLVAVATCDTAAEQLRGCSVRRHARSFFCGVQCGCVASFVAASNGYMGQLLVIPPCQSGSKLWGMLLVAVPAHVLTLMDRGMLPWPPLCVLTYVYRNSAGKQPNMLAWWTALPSWRCQLQHHRTDEPAGLAVEPRWFSACFFHQCWVT